MALTRRVPRIALALVALALVVRLAFIAATGGYVPQHDDRDYDRLACGLVAGEGYTRVGPPTPREGCGHEPTGRATAFRPPGFPMFLAAIYTATEPIGVERWTAARVAQALVGAAVVALLGLVAWQLFGRRTALIAMALAAVFPPLIVVGGSLLTETLFCAFMLGALAAVLAYRRSPGGDWRWLILAGVASGLAVLTRSNAPALLLPLAIGVAASGDLPLRARLGRAAALVGIAALTVAPWTLRNASALDGFAPVATEAGSALAGTYNDASRNDPEWPGAWRPPARLRELKPTLDPVRRNEPAEQRALIRHSLGYMADHPGYVAEVGGRNILRLTGLEGRDWWHHSGSTLSLPTWTADVSAVAFLIFLVVAIIGAFTPAARGTPWWLWLMPVLMVLSALFVVGETRFRVTSDPFVVLLAALAVAHVARPSKRKAPPAA
jgi:4-amino-4-deoxy-L-arabinose transferase-like glycosyltransferase